jgi:hypothetical protein
MPSLRDRLRGWLSRPALERAEEERYLSPVERENAKLDYESRKDDEALLHGAVEEDIGHFDDDSREPHR